MTGILSLHAIASNQAPGSPLPRQFVWMPAGTHSISAHSANEPGGAWRGGVRCDQSAAAAVQRDLVAALARGQRVWIDFNHDDAEAAAWVRSFEWDPSRGVVATVDWTPAGEEAIRTKKFYSFSPAFSVEQETGRVAGLLAGKAAGGLVNAPAFGAAMPALVAARHMPERAAPATRQALFELLTIYKSTPDQAMKSKILNDINSLSK